MVEIRRSLSDNFHNGFVTSIVFHSCDRKGKIWFSRSILNTFIIIWPRLCKKCHQRTWWRRPGHRHWTKIAVNVRSHLSRNNPLGIFHYGIIIRLDLGISFRIAWDFEEENPVFIKEFSKTILFFIEFLGIGYCEITQYYQKSQDAIFFAFLFYYLTVYRSWILPPVLCSRTICFRRSIRACSREKGRQIALIVRVNNGLGIVNVSLRIKE